MKKRFLGVLAAISLSSPARAVLNGTEVSSMKSPYAGYSQTVRNEIFDCSGVFVSQNTLLTAAHCFDALTEKCTTLGTCRRKNRNVFAVKRSNTLELRINGQVSVRAYTLIIHPFYSPKNYATDDHRQTNHDLALVILQQNLASDSYLPVALSPPRSGELLASYGNGMSELTLFAQPETDTVYNLEDGIGRLKKADFSVQMKAGGELLQAHSVLIGKRLNRTNFAMNPLKGGQILGSDSGGPLVKEGKIVAITRNYELSFVTSDLGKVQKGLKKNFYMTGKSVFTALQTKKNRQFLLSAQKYGGKVYFH